MVDKARCRAYAERLRMHLGVAPLDPVDMVSVAMRVPKLTLVMYPLGAALSGMCIKRSRYSLIAVNSAQTKGRQNFTIAHELYHLFFDRELDGFQCAKKAGGHAREETADCFASFFVLPHQALEARVADFLANGGKSPRVLAISSFDGIDDDALQVFLLGVEAEFGISRTALLVRLVSEGLLEEGRCTVLRRQVRNQARRYGFSLSVYEPSFGNDAKKVVGDYVDKVMLLHERDAVSDARALELLRDGFRNDIHLVDFPDGDIDD